MIKHLKKPCFSRKFTHIWDHSILGVFLFRMGLSWKTYVLCPSSRIHTYPGLSAGDPKRITPWEMVGPEKGPCRGAPKKWQEWNAAHPDKALKVHATWRGWLWLTKSCPFVTHQAKYHAETTYNGAQVFPGCKLDDVPLHDFQAFNFCIYFAVATMGLNPLILIILLMLQDWECLQLQLLKNSKLGRCKARRFWQLKG